MTRWFWPDKWPVSEYKCITGGGLSLGSSEPETRSDISGDSRHFPDIKAFDHFLNLWVSSLQSPTDPPILLAAWIAWSRQHNRPSQQGKDGGLGLGRRVEREEVRIPVDNQCPKGTLLATLLLKVKMRQNGNSLPLKYLHISLGWGKDLHFTDEYTEVQRAGTTWPKLHSRRRAEPLSHPRELQSKATPLAEPTTCTGGHYINSATDAKTKDPVYPWGVFSTVEKKWGVRVIECYCPMLCPHVSSHEISKHERHSTCFSI